MGDDSKIVESLAKLIFVTHNAGQEWHEGYRTTREAELRNDRALSHEECRALGRAFLEHMRMLNAIAQGRRAN